MQIEINLAKLERGTHTGRVKVIRGGKTFWRKQRVGRKSSETVEGVKKKISGYMTSGKVDLPDVPIEDLNGILKGLDNTLGKYGSKLNTMEFATDFIAGIGRYDADENSIYFTKDKLLNLKRDIKVGIEHFKKSMSEDINEINDFLDGGGLSSGTVQELEGRLSRLKAVRTANIMCDVPESEVVAVVATHEAYHSIYYTNKNIENEWNRLLAEKMEDAGVRDLNHLPQALSVSEYGACSSSELFAETGAALAYNLPISEEMKNIFNTVLKGIKE